MSYRLYEGEWIKLHTSILNDRAFNIMSDDMKRRLIEAFLQAGIENDGGEFYPEDNDEVLSKLVDCGMVLKYENRYFVSHLFGIYYSYGSEYLNTTTVHKHVLKSQRWRHFRKVVFWRNKFLCTKCGRADGDVVLHCHHITYDNIGNESYDDCVSLCQECHNKHHQNKNLTRKDRPCSICGVPHNGDSQPCQYCYPIDAGSFSQVLIARDHHLEHRGY